MKKLFEKIQAWWYFHVKNPVVRKGEYGGFKWEFRRFWLDISTVSGNFSARYMADEHPYAYLLAGAGDDNIIGFCQFVYILSKTMTTDQGLTDDIGKALKKFEKRLDKEVEKRAKVEDETEEKIALEEVKQVQEYVEMEPKERKKVERDANGRFKKVVKAVENEEKGN